MLITNRPLISIFSLLSVGYLLTACDQVQTVTKKLKVLRENGKETAAVTAAALSPEPVQTIDASTFASFVSQKDKLVIVDFYADWCGPCKMMGPVLEKATTAHPGIVSLGKVNVDHAGQLPGEQGVSGIPDVRFFKNGKQVDRFVGFPGEETVLEKVEALTKEIPAAPAPTTTTAPVVSSEPKIQRMKKDWLPPGMERR